MPLTLRAAAPSDRSAVESLIAREVRAGAVLPRAFDPEAFLVAEVDGAVAGTLALSRWSDDVIELGTVIAARPGLGIGSQLVAAGLDRAARLGAGWAVVLTGSAGFFARQGFEEVADAPWARARGPVALPDGPAPLHAAVGLKAAGTCRRCPHLATCRQDLLARALRPAAEAVA